MSREFRWEVEAFGRCSGGGGGGEPGKRGTGAEVVVGEPRP